ncbi:UDP-glucose--hexose-1-phosphate uridylyltransferase [Chryseobacterium sp. PTM-20240506]|uniref:UDP-glucose--hexose-1-phosphate uridylyltransferase n=1 Tax=unclassified Chryseobacterium TaxID=2593645 RepID=UPI002358E1F9|nr:UDP-glucose--hexose-1-phosphate uridylyltransferase [Chryseobacterium sp. B21-037]MDC8103547.1 UDP-glucose--hexose-1-phosphate uridylyltransferase [Chryseobacterium sp. B21-037]
MNTSFDRNKHPHRRYNPLLNEWILVSPQRANRPWQGQREKTAADDRPAYDPDCYLCSGNWRANGARNPDYKGTYVFNNDFGALLNEEVDFSEGHSGFFTLLPERGINRVVCFSEDHSLTLPEMSVEQIKNVVDAWQAQFIELAAFDHINYIQIFENKGSIMGCSNPHPHGQIWAQSSVPAMVQKTQDQLKSYFEKNKRTLLEDYIEQEITAGERMVTENENFAALVPFWASWPYETMIISKQQRENIAAFSEDEKESLAAILKDLTTIYDNLFETSFPYSAGIHQSPTDGKQHPEWHFHMHFYPPLLRSAEVKKFMVGYEMLAEPQRDITPEQSAAILRSLPRIHYKKK